MAAMRLLSWLQASKHIFVSFLVGREQLGMYGGGAVMERLRKTLLCLKQRNLRQSLRLAKWSLLDWKTHIFFSPRLLPATKPHHVLFPSWSPYPQFILTPVHRHVVFLPPNLSVPLRFKVQVSVFWSANPFSLCHSCLFLFPSPLLTFHTYSIAVSSLSTFHLPIPTFIRSFWGFFLFVCPMFFLF